MATTEATERHAYRVWMRDGYARLVVAATPDEAKRIAAEMAAGECRGVAMSYADHLRAAAVDYVDVVR